MIRSISLKSEDGRSPGTVFLTLDAFQLVLVDDNLFLCRIYDPVFTDTGLRVNHVLQTIVHLTAGRRDNLENEIWGSGASAVGQLIRIADLKRLNFIVDGEANLNTSFSTHCPFCDGEVVVKKNQNYIDAAKSDYKKIKLQAKDLESASKELRSEKLSLEQEIGTLMAKKKSIEELIEKELKPQVFNLKEKLSTYKDAIECQKEIDILKKLSEQKTARP